MPATNTSPFSSVTLGFVWGSPNPSFIFFPVVRLQQIAAGKLPAAGMGLPLSPCVVISTCGMLPSGRIVMGSAQACRE